MDDIKLTHYSHGAGCGCKISPAVLEMMLHSQMPSKKYPDLLVGNESKDDAAVYALNEDQGIISTTDFFMPIVDDPFDFGVIASVNAISDVYAMGGKPLMAIAILGWPIHKLSADVAQQVLDGSRNACLEAGIPLAGGHSIDCPEPIFGLAVTGLVKRTHLKQNNTAVLGSCLYLTKPLGVGIVTTAQKKGVVKPSHLQHVIESMKKLNSIGSTFGTWREVNAMTDVTGFGLLGHLLELCEGSGLSAEIHFSKIPRFDFLEHYIAENTIPGGTLRNLSSYEKKVTGLTDFTKTILADPQTSGGLLVSVRADSTSEFELKCARIGLPIQPIGQFIQRGEFGVTVFN